MIFNFRFEPIAQNKNVTQLTMGIERSRDVATVGGGGRQSPPLM